MRRTAHIVVLGAVTLALVSSCGGPTQRAGTLTLPRPADLASTAGAYPPTFVGSTGAGLALFDSTSGGLLRKLTTAPADGGDRYPTLSDDRTTVYFIRATSSCGRGGSSGGIWAASTGGALARQVITTPAGNVDLAPVVSADGHMLAWTRTACDRGAPAIFIRDLGDRAERMIATSSDNVVQPLAWAPDDRHLLVATVSDAEHVSVLDTVSAGSTADAVPVPVSSCGRYFPRYLTDGVVVALTCSPGADAGEGAALALFDPTTGRQLGEVQFGIPLPSPSSPAFRILIPSFSCSPDATAAIWTTTPGPGHPYDVWRWSHGRAALLPVAASEVVW